MSNIVSQLLALAATAFAADTFKGAIVTRTHFKNFTSIVVASFFETADNMVRVAYAVFERKGFKTETRLGTVKVLTREEARIVWTVSLQSGGERLPVPAQASKKASGAQPHFEHDCDKCRYVGSAETKGFGKFDAYVCKAGGEACIIARLSDEPADNLATPVELAKLAVEHDASYPISMGYQLALLAGAV